MFRKVRKVKNEISIDEAKLLLKKNRRAAFSVNGDDGYPYSIPINFYYDEDENKIYFHTGKQGYKMDSLRANDKICFTTWDDGYLEDGDWAYYVSSCVVFGRARLIEDRKLMEEKLRVFARKYYPTEEEIEEAIGKGLHAVQMVAIDVEHISGKRVQEK